MFNLETHPGISVYSGLSHGLLENSVGNRIGVMRQWNDLISVEMKKSIYSDNVTWHFSILLWGIFNWGIVFLCWFWSSAQLGVEADSVSGLRWHLVNEPCISALVLEITAVCLYVAVLWTVTVKEADIQFTEGLHKNKYRKCFVCMQFYFELVFICRFIIDYYCVMRNNVLMMMRKTIFDVLKRNFADFKPGPHINISNVYLYCQTCRITISACHWLNTSTFNVTLMVRVALKIILQPAVKSWIINQKHVNISLMFKNTIMSL